MKKICSLILSSIVFTVAHAQTVGTTALETAQLARRVERAVAAGNNLCIPWLQTVENTGLYPFQISWRLAGRALDSYEQAKDLHTQIDENHRLIFGQPAYAAKADVNTNTNLAENVCSQIDFLQTKKQAQLWMTLHNNFLYQRELARMEKKVWPRFDRDLPALKKAALHFQQPENPLRWVVQNLDKKVENLFVGEVHNIPEIKEAMIQLLRELRQAQPNRKIVVLTEFLPRLLTYTVEEKNMTEMERHIASLFFLDSYFGVWDEALRLNMEVIGLELPLAVTDKTKLYTVDTDGDKQKLKFWRTLEGVRMRNHSFIKTIRQLREESPDALFVIYTGAGHSFYNAPYSLTKGVKKENSFVLDLFPDKRPKVVVRGYTIELSTTSKVDPLEAMSNFTVSFPQRLLYFEDPELARTAGFDARLKVHADMPKILE